MARDSVDSRCPTLLPPRPEADELDATRLPPPPRVPVECGPGTVRPGRAGRKRSGVTLVPRRPSIAPLAPLAPLRAVAWTVAP